MIMINLFDEKSFLIDLLESTCTTENYDKSFITENEDWLINLLESSCTTEIEYWLID